MFELEIRQDYDHYTLYQLPCGGGLYVFKGGLEPMMSMTVAEEILRVEFHGSPVLGGWKFWD